MSYDYQDEYNTAIGTKLLEPGEEPPLDGVQMYERGQFVYGAGPFAPGGPGGGMTIGPQFRTPGPASGPMSCPQVSGGTLVCVQAPMTERGVATGRGWPPEIGPQEEQLMEAGCVATGRRCGGSTRAPAQYWCCPSPGGMPMPFIGTPFPHGAGALGSNGFSTFLERYRTLMLVTGAGVLAWLAWKAYQRKSQAVVPVVEGAGGGYVPTRKYPVKRRSIWAPPGVALEAVGDVDWALFEPEVRDRVTEWSLGIVSPSYSTPGKWEAGVNTGYGVFKVLGEFKSSDDAVMAVLKAAEKVPISGPRPTNGPRRKGE